MNDIDSPEAQARREAFYNRMCKCGHAFGNHGLMFSGGCLLCECGGPSEDKSIRSASVPAPQTSTVDSSRCPSVDRSLSGSGGNTR